MREFVLNDCQLLHEIGVNWFVETKGVWRIQGMKTVGKLWMNCLRTLIRRSRRDELLFLVRCLNDIIKPWNEVWALAKGSKDDFLQLKLMR